MQIFNQYYQVLNKVKPDESFIIFITIYRMHYHWHATPVLGNNLKKQKIIIREIKQEGEFLRVQLNYI